jgi:hypothetical protein
VKLYRNLIHRSFTEALQKLHRSFIAASQKLHRSIIEASQKLFRKRSSKELGSVPKALAPSLRSSAPSLRSWLRA